MSIVMLDLSDLGDRSAPPARLFGPAKRPRRIMVAALRYLQHAPSAIAQRSKPASEPANRRPFSKHPRQDPRGNIATLVLQDARYSCAQRAHGIG